MNYPSYDDCLKDEGRLSELFCFVGLLCITVVLNYMHIIFLCHK